MDNKPTILVVDDNEYVRNIMSNLLRTLKFEVVIATNGQGALQLLSDKVSLVITDFNMTGMNGVQLAHKVRQHYPHLPIIIMSGNIKEAQAAANGLEVVAWVEKPFRFSSLQEALRKAIPSWAPQ